MIKQTRNGFTLLELMVVVGIIAILLGLGSLSYSTAQRKSRDARRKGDVKEIQSSMEQYYSICGFVYPTPVSGAVAPVICPNPTTAIMPTVPVDPKTITPYPCAGCTATSYNICATLETETNPFCVNNQQ